MADRGNVIAVENETRSTISRMTMENKRITYRLQVLQQPIRARACGSGAKSSADRRPVDPPPIVELKIFEGEPNNEEDITFNMNANYFLFATLEQARPIKQGRVPEDKNRATVLTGAPVAGMVYLDRPSPAGYFIFPDLSVRHEGKYRLSFSLYEELKNPKDFDKASDSASMNSNGEAHVTHRLEVKSEPFIVFSAKKFPGLTESTSLSRMVAEQGCRVRIRRDVRMRKRESKPGKDWDDYEDETAAARASMSATPDVPQYAAPHSYMDSMPRPRSTSNTSHHSLAASISRRPSNSDISVQYNTQQYSVPPRTPQPVYAQPLTYGQLPVQQFSHSSSFGPQHSTMQPPPAHYTPHQSQVQHHQQQQQQHQLQSQGQPLQAPEHQQQLSQPHLQNGPPTAQPQHDNCYTYSGTIPPLQHPQYTPLHSAQASHTSHARLGVDCQALSHGEGANRSSMSFPAPAPPATLSQGAAPPYGQGTQPAYSPRSQASHQGFPPSQQQPAAMYTGHDHPPRGQKLEARAASSNYETPSDLPGRNDNLLPPLLIPESSNKTIEPLSPAPSSQLSGYYNSADSSHKRSYGNVFNDRHLAQPLRDGARPNGVYANDLGIGNGGPDFAADDTDTVPDLDPSRMSMRYRRADGSSIVRALPPHN